MSGRVPPNRKPGGASVILSKLLLLNIIKVNAFHTYLFSIPKNAADYEWKYARCVLWMWYIEQEGTMPAPFNIIPPAKIFLILAKKILEKLCPRWFSSRKKSASQGNAIGGILSLAGMKLAGFAGEGIVANSDIEKKRRMSKFEKKFSMVCR